MPVFAFGYAIAGKGTEEEGREKEGRRDKGRRQKKGMLRLSRRSLEAKLEDADKAGKEITEKWLNPSSYELSAMG